MKIVKYLLSMILFTFVCSSCEYNAKRDLIKNYTSKLYEINSLYEYVNNLTSDSVYFDIEFLNDRKISYFFVSIKRIDPRTGISYTTNIVADGDYNSNYMSNRNLDFNSQNLENLLKIVGWSKNDLKTLKKKLDKANCISVRSGEFTKIGNFENANPMTIGYKRVFLGMYSYKIFTQELSENLINQYNDGCTYVFFQDNIVFEYKGGATGKQCF